MPKPNVYNDGVIGEQVSLADGYDPDAWYYHPVFFHDSNNYDGSNLDALLDAYNLECEGFYLGEGYPRALEVPLRVAYDNAKTGEMRASVLRTWMPRPTSLNGSGWFLLYTAPTEFDGPYACFARVKDGQK